MCAESSTTLLLRHLSDFKRELLNEELLSCVLIVEENRIRRRYKVHGSEGRFSRSEFEGAGAREVKNATPWTIASRGRVLSGRSDGEGAI